MSGKIICPKCDGNGFRMIYKDASWKEKVPIDCSHCNNQGEVEITDQEINNLLENSNWRTQ
jgi:DnaJ-class molecular chaperone